MTEEKYIALKRHPLCEGLDSDGLEELSNAATLSRLAPDEHVVKGKQKVSSVFLVTQGRMRGLVYDLHDQPLLDRILTRNTEFGLLACAQRTPMNLEIYATEPSTLVQIEHRRLLEIASRYPVLQLNLFRLAGDSVRQSANIDRRTFRPPMVAVIHHSQASRPLTCQLVEHLKRVEKTPCVASDDPDWEPQEGVVFRNLIVDGELITPEEGREQMHRWADHGRILVDISIRHGLDAITRLISNADIILWCIQPKDAAEAIKFLSYAENKVPGWREKICLVWILDKKHLITPHEPDLTKLATHQFKLSFEGPAEHQGMLVKNGIHRIVQFLRGIRIGIALGGGAARGMAHLGVLKVLEENGLFVNMIAGTSAGAMTGMLYCYGMSVDYSIDRFKADLTPSWFYRRLPHGGYWYLLHKYRRGLFDSMLRRYMGNARIEQLPIPMHAITVDLVKGEPVVRETGDAVHAIVESINLPGFSSPICRDGRALVDGGLVNNIPANVLVSKGCNFVIASSVTAKLEPEFANISPNRILDGRRRPSTLQTILRGYMVQSVNMNSVGVGPADVVIDSDVTNFGLDEFTRTDELSAVGREAALSQVPKIKNLLSEIDPELYPKTSAES